MQLPEPVANAIRNVAIRGLLLKERWQSGVTFNPLSQELRSNPYRVYHRLRSKDPLHRSELMKGWVASTYSDVSAIMRDPRFSVDASKSGLDPAEMGAFFQVF